MASEQQRVGQVYFFQKSMRECDAVGSAVRKLGAAYIAAWFVYALIAIKMAKVCGLDSIPVLLLAQLLLLPLIGRYVIARRRRDRMLGDLPVHKPWHPVRLACVGFPRQLERCGELADTAFEPIFFSATFVQPFSKRMEWIGVILAIPAIVLAHCVGTYLLGGSISDWARGGLLKGCIWATIAICLVAWLWPTYFRIVPGRLDVLRFNNLLNRPVSVEHYNLRTAKLLIDLRRSVIFIDDADGRTGEFPIVWMRRRTRERLAYHLLLAAISTHQTPMLPDDRLLG